MIYNLGLLRYIFLRGFPHSLLARRLVTIAFCITNTCLGFFSQILQDQKLALYF